MQGHKRIPASLSRKPAIHDARRTIRAGRRQVLLSGVGCQALHHWLIAAGLLLLPLVVGYLVGLQKKQKQII
jgi:hypothetical protein